MKFADKVVVVTGGTSGIGLETARLFRAEGAKVAIIGSNDKRLEEAERQLGGDVIALRADLRDPGQIDKAIAEVVETHGHIDVVFANAGAGIAAPLEAVTQEQIEQQFSLNFSGLFFTIQKAVPHLREGGSIVATTSFLNEVGTPGLSILSASKAAVRSLDRTDDQPVPTLVTCSNSFSLISRCTPPGSKGTRCRCSTPSGSSAVARPGTPPRR